MPRPIDPRMKAALITIGNEILLGKTVNTNLAWLGQQMAGLGIPVSWSVVIQDEREAILKALGEAWLNSDIVISTGGLGPTEDDITKSCIAEFFGKSLYFDAEVWEHVQRLFSRRGVPIPDLNRNQAMVPEGFRVLKNELGTAPGLAYGDDNKLFCAMQGVPMEMQHIFHERLVPIIKEMYPGMKPVIQRTLHTWGISESRLAELYHLSDLPPGVSLAWLPQTGRVDLRFYGPDRNAITQAEQCAMKAVSEYVWGFDNDRPAEALLHSLTKYNASLSVAESCTGGWVQKLLTDIPGASEHLLGGVVTYANDLKMKLLQVPQDVLENDGAVSEACALAMAHGVKQLTGSDYAISVTGIAGPDGGSESKPVGTVWFGFEAHGYSWAKKQIMNGNRESIRYKAAEFAILEMIKHLRSRSI